MLTFLFVSVRWAPIAGTADFGYLHEAAERILAGEVLNRDFFSVLPPLPPYVVAAFYAVVGTDVIWHQVLAYLAWGASITGGVLLARQLGGRLDSLAAGAALGLSLGLPAASWTLLYNDLVVALIVFAVLLMVRLVKYRRGLLSLFCSGALLGLSVGIKQNIGLGMTAAALLGLPLFAATQMGWRSGIVWLVILCAGVACGLLPLLALLLPYHDVSGLWIDFVEGASAGRGGFLTTLLRPFPRPILETWEPSLARRAVELVSGAVLLLFGLRVLLRLRRPIPAAVERPRWWPLAVLCLLSVLALAPWPALPEAANRIASYFAQLSLTGLLLTVSHFLLCLLLFATIVRLLAAGVRGNREAQVALFVAVALLGLALGQASSRIYYVGSVVAAAGPALAELSARWLGIPAKAFRTFALLAMVVMVLGPGMLTSFQVVQPLDAGPKFAMLWGRESVATRYRHLWDEVHPRIVGKRTLWLAVNGPWSAFGGLPVPSAVNNFAFSHRREHEVILFEAWQAAPPDRIVAIPTIPIANSYWQEDDRLRRWIEDNYVVVWSDDEIVLWARCDGASTTQCSSQ